MRDFGAWNYQLIHDGQVWRLISSIVLNGDILEVVMSTFYVFFIFTHLENSCNFLSMAGIVILGSISSNITLAIFGDMVDLKYGVGPAIYSALGAFYAYLTIHWEMLSLIRSTVLCIIGMLTFFAFLFSIGTYGFSCFCGGMVGGYLSGLALLQGLKPKKFVYIAIGIIGLVAYWIMMFLVFYLAT